MHFLGFPLSHRSNGMRFKQTHRFLLMHETLLQPAGSMSLKFCLEFFSKRNWTHGNHSSQMMNWQLDFIKDLFCTALSILNSSLTVTVKRQRNRIMNSILMLACKKKTRVSAAIMKSAKLDVAPTVWRLPPPLSSYLPSKYT